MTSTPSTLQRRYTADTPVAEPMPRKAVPGWQAETIAHFQASLYTIAEVR